MTEDVQVGGDADQKLQSQLYIGKSTCVSTLSSCSTAYSYNSCRLTTLCLIKLCTSAQEVRKNIVDL